MNRREKDTTWTQACLLAGLAMSSMLLREAVHSHRSSPVAALLPGLVLVATRSSAIGRVVLALSILIGRIWMLKYEPPWDINTLLHCTVVAALFHISEGIRGPASFAFLLLTAGWTPLWVHTEFGNFQETSAALGVLGVYLARTRWRLPTSELRKLSGALFVALMVFGGSVHIPLMVLTLSAFWIVSAPLLPPRNGGSSPPQSDRAIHEKRGIVEP